jgi:hypothetical protein
LEILFPWKGFESAMDQEKRKAQDTMIKTEREIEKDDFIDYES